jgi:hypothetical protein
MAAVKRAAKKTALARPIDPVLLRRLEYLESQRLVDGRWDGLCRLIEKWTSQIQSNEVWLRSQLQQLEPDPAPQASAPLARLAFHFLNDEGPGIVVVAAGDAEYWRAQFDAPQPEATRRRAHITDIHGRAVYVNVEYVTYVEIEPAEAAR